MMTRAPLDYSTASELLDFNLSIDVQALVERKGEPTFALELLSFLVGFFLFPTIKLWGGRIWCKSSGQLQSSLCH